ncbi:MAG: SIMPL domain-containing protein [Dehalococcoidales bacterium]|nr:SIMPL domain-containing protein [Dehalococcoidales bacterium]
MNRKWLFLIGGLAMVVPLVAFTGCVTSPVENGSPESVKVELVNQQQGIWVNGQGEVEAVPDVATVWLGVEAEDVTVAAAQEKAASAMNEVMAALKNSGIADEDIRTEQFSIQRITRWDYDREEEIVDGYRVSNMVTAKVREVDQAGPIIDTVVLAGGDFIRVNNISFSIDDPKTYQEEARALAVADAKAKAENMASLAGVELGKVTYISESGGYYPVVYRDYVVEEASAPAPTPIEPGELTISISVQIAYNILE